MERLPIKPMLTILILLCFSDALLTDIGLRADLIEEWNPLVRRIYEWSLPAYYAGKLILPIFLFLLLPYLNVRTWMKSLMTIATAAYALVNLYHLIWVALAFRTIASM